ncbi:MAG: beta-N-acetylhexosaminidase [Hyphomonadaceae bacterium]|nr:beta-N-acetylhexosaminidase [Hyphomonadaceae bacterium]
MLSCALGIRQAKVDDDLRAFLRETSPWALILFREACVTNVQARRLCADLRAALGRDCLIWIDQEGGRVARLKAPEWPVWPAAARYGDLYSQDPERALEACSLGHRLIAHELREIGVNADFAPVLDVPVAGADPVVVGDRAFSAKPDVISNLARAALSALHAGGVAGCIKHMPGHGRATSDTHFTLPRVVASALDLANDLSPFMALADAEAALTAHIIYEAWDEANPGTCSPSVIRSVIREKIGFRGLLMTDDLDMKALAVVGDLRNRAAAALDAGCEVVLQCSGVLKDMEAVASACKPLAGEALARAQAVEAIAARAPEPFDTEAGWARFKALLQDLETR